MSQFHHLTHLLVFALAYKAYKSKSLTHLGILASIVTGLIHTVHPWFLPFVLLAGFYLPSSKFTKLKADIKAKLTVKVDNDASSELHLKDGGEGPRSHIQVLANSIVATALIIVQLATRSSQDLKCWSSDPLVVGIIA